MESDYDMAELDEFERFTEIGIFEDPFDEPEDPVKLHVDLKLKADDVTLAVVRIDKKKLNAFQGQHSLTEIFYDPDIMKTACIMEWNHPELMVADYTYDPVIKWVNASVPGIYYENDPKVHSKESVELEGSVKLKAQASRSSGEQPAKSPLFTIFQTIRPDPNIKITVELDQKPKPKPVKRAVSPSEVNSLGKRGYFLIEKIGEGTFSTVWRSLYTAAVPLGHPPEVLACKLMNRKNLDSHAKTFSDREIDIVARLCHDNVIKHHSIVERKEKLFIFMRLAEGGDVETYLAKNGYLKEPQTKEWMRQLASALQYLHIRGVAHRDLKCSNILITEKNNLKISDFGFSRFSLDRFGKRILSETWCGSPVYSAPEIILGDAYDPFITDCWSLGVCMYAMLTASLPYSGGVSLNKLLQSQYEQLWTIHPDIMKDLSAECLRVLQRLMQPDIKYRMTVTGLMNSPWFKEPLPETPPRFLTRIHIPLLSYKL